MESPTESRHGIEDAKTHGDSAFVETARPPSSDLNYDEAELEPAIHARTYFALVAMFLLNMVQVLALQGPPAVVRKRPNCLFVVRFEPSSVIGV